MLRVTSAVNLGDDGHVILSHEDTLLYEALLDEFRRPFLKDTEDDEDVILRVEDLEQVTPTCYLPCGLPSLLLTLSIYDDI